MFLHSYLFFGSANRLHQHVKALLAKQKCRFLLFDFRLVTGIDSSATFSFTQIKQVADQCGARMIFTRLTRDVENAFRAARFISDHIIVAPNLDAALESCGSIANGSRFSRTKSSYARGTRPTPCILSWTAESASW